MMRFLFCTAAVAALTRAGCSKKGPHIEKYEVYPVEGQVIWKGKPLAEARLEFFPKGWSLRPYSHTPVAVTGPDGRFQLSSYGGGDGAPAGKYIITVVCRDPTIKGKQMYSTANILPKQYSQSATSGLEVEVVEGKNVVPPLDLGGKPDAPSDKKSAK